MVVKIVALTIIEILLIATFYILQQVEKVVDMRLEPKVDILSDDRPDIVMVHGLASPNLFHLFTRSWLEAKGYDLYITDFGRQRGDMVETANSLKQYIEERDLHNVTLLGFSQGGVINLYYLEKLGGWQGGRIDRLITVASPLRGSRFARLIDIPAGKQLRVGSDFMKDLMGEDGLGTNLQNKNKIHSIRSKFDQVVSVKNSYVEGINNYQLNIYGHSIIQGASKQTINKIDEIIKLDK